MVRSEFTFLSTDGVTQLHAVQWLPDSNVRAVLQLVHGVAEYIMRYDPFASFLTEHGFAVVGHDHLGHGLSVAEGAPRLYFGPRGSWDWVVSDIRTLQEQTRHQYPDVPYFILGHSMGSFLLRTYLARYPGTVDGAILMGTTHMNAIVLAGAKLFAAIECLRVGEQNPSAAVLKLSFGAYNRKFAPNRTPYDWVTLSRATVDTYLTDPMCGENPSMGLFREMQAGMAFMGRPETVRQMDPDLPVLFVSGAMDPVGGLGRGVEKAFRLFQNNGMRNVSMKLYPQLRHEILNEDCKEDIFRDLLQWLTEQMPA